MFTFRRKYTLIVTSAARSFNFTDIDTTSANFADKNAACVIFCF